MTRERPRKPRQRKTTWNKRQESGRTQEMGQKIEKGAVLTAGTRYGGGGVRNGKSEVVRSNHRSRKEGRKTKMSSVLVLIFPYLTMQSCM